MSTKVEFIKRGEEQFYILGKSVERIDAVPKVTGEAVYGYDLSLPKMLYGKIKHSSIPHGIIKKIDVSKAEKLAGVRAIITGKDAPDSRYGLVLFDRYVIAKDRVRFIGEAVAAVAADTPEIAEKALDLIEVEYEELPAVFDPEEAMKPDAPILHPDLKKYKTSITGGPWIPFDIPNLNNYRRVVFGNVEEGFKNSYLIVENKYKTSMVQHAHMEPQSCVCSYNPDDDSYTVYTSTQSPFRFRFELSLALNVPENKIRVVSPLVGGGFGNKLTIYAEPIACLLARKTGRPVKIVLTREEVFTFTTVRPPTITYIKDGVSKDGTLLAREIKFYVNGGAYSGGSGISVYTYLAAQGIATYKPKNIKLEIFSTYTNLPPQGPLRGVGPAIIDLAIERQMDILAKKLGLDPVEIRLKNIPKQGEENVFGETVDVDLSKIILTAYNVLKQRLDEGDKPTYPWKRGIGIALSEKYSLAPTASSARVKLREDGVIEVFIGSTEIGQGNYTIMQQLVAEEFKVPMDRVKIVAAADSELTPFDEAQMSSRTTVALGNALLLACEKLKENIAKYASKKLNEDANYLEVREGYVISKRNPDKKLKLEDLFARGKIRTGTFLENEGELIASANWYIPAGVDKETGRIYDKYGNKVFERIVNFYTPAAIASEVWVNVETGQIKVKKLVAAVDAGKVFNPKLVEGQIVGGSAMGLSIALYEELKWQKGYALNANFADYSLIQHADLPEMEVIATETPLSHGPFGARGVGEVGLLASIAVPNAVSDAIGKDVKQIPLTPEYILKLLEEE